MALFEDVSVESHGSQYTTFYTYLADGEADAEKLRALVQHLCAKVVDNGFGLIRVVTVPVRNYLRQIDGPQDLTVFAFRFRAAGLLQNARTSLERSVAKSTAPDLCGLLFGDRFTSMSAPAAELIGGDYEYLLELQRDQPAKRRRLCDDEPEPDEVYGADRDSSLLFSFGVSPLRSYISGRVPIDDQLRLILGRWGDQPVTEESLPRLLAIVADLTQKRWIPTQTNATQAVNRLEAVLKQLKSPLPRKRLLTAMRLTEKEGGCQICQRSTHQVDRLCSFPCWKTFQSQMLCDCGRVHLALALPCDGCGCHALKLRDPIAAAVPSLIFLGL